MISAHPVGLTERQQAILERLERSGRVSVAELSRELGVSEVTTRKDLQELEERSLLKRVYGGAVAAHRSKYNLSLGDKVGHLALNKQRIAEAALALIHDGDTLILDAGSTTLALARLLPGRRRGLTIITNALPILAELSSAEGFELISLGGLVRSHSLAMIGPQTVANLRALHADRAFLGATGVTLRGGLSTPNLIEAETKAAMVAAAESCAALVDHSKVGSSSLAPFAPWEALDVFVTDAPLPRDLSEHLRACGVRVICAEPAGAL
ncbi:DeoR/GlpR family DNA-binding transcription regulator [Truepera radiovictrix]|uniref:Transcriptional regulator, DeoR family n=1 Tax=Truepera radiovictrix (strain DSM 17093 / CIP 108686 / LMG 22925 / RQ-24) TaxID=649638 RepID=D7CWG1_TRURR|nr:DeoR/GlpR family DNA-binding transcription regulator [Truepera radiovictrix]ADI14360.1 transcriptional regulator, DeoR family [Truepera radiovictrix DSM 17093]WMT57083.1 DeoR/GlpR family DNA-binding transcription regulator [Truepera radiovictrix]